MQWPAGPSLPHGAGVQGVQPAQAPGRLPHPRRGLGREQVRDWGRRCHWEVWGLCTFHVDSSEPPRPPTPEILWLIVAITQVRFSRLELGPWGSTCGLPWG